MTLKDCPKCRLANSACAIKCDCGYNFDTHRQETPIGQSGSAVAYNRNIPKNFVAATGYPSYRLVPTHRKRWFVVLCLMFCAPIAMFVAMSGDIYLQQHGRILKYSEKSKAAMIAMAALLSLSGLFHFIDYVNRPF